MNDQNIEAFVYTGANWLVNAIPNLVAAVAILVIGYLIAGWLSRLITGLMTTRAHADPTLTPVVASLIRYFVLIITFIAVLGQLGVQIASMLAVLGAAGLAIGLALQGTLSNIAAGLMLLWLRPFRAGEAIEANGVNGTVVEVGLFATQMRSPDGLYFFVPNADLWNTPIKNFSRNATRRIEIAIGIDYDDDIETARRVLGDMLAADERVLKDPEPMVLVSSLGASSVDLVARFWVASADFAQAASDLTARAKDRVTAAGLTIPYPQQVVRSSAPAAASATDRRG